MAEGTREGSRVCSFLSPCHVHNGPWASAVQHVHLSIHTTVEETQQEKMGNGPENEQNNCEQSLQDAFSLCRRRIHSVIKQEVHSQVRRGNLVFVFVLETGPEAAAWSWGQGWQLKAPVSFLWAQLLCAAIKGPPIPHPTLQSHAPGERASPSSFSHLCFLANQEQLSLAVEIHPATICCWHCSQFYVPWFNNYWLSFFFKGGVNRGSVLIRRKIWAPVFSNCTVIGQLLNFLVHQFL